MTEPRVPGHDDSTLELPCGETVDVHGLDMGMREFDCDCGATHAIVMDVHPLARFVPEFLVEILEQTVETADDHGAFGTTHMMGVVLEEFPDEVASKDVSEDGAVGCTLIWVTDFDSRRLHEIVVELVVELMEHAVSHAEDDGAMSEFERRMSEFDVDSFVEQYRQERDIESEHDEVV
ncbi:DUF5815 family protein [Haloarculaceae archaeon H-GB2-1]|nr:DUF5815 family protein [Haloarculaceae archaeon H-GB1-1]MEA5386048.1 DUF5815 family protein [Haloarculaceae archaeon H-GB11]MEA5407555.1 DUF5815 family protein [Haloarculaceae archaeon H-GB2-1]